MTTNLQNWESLIASRNRDSKAQRIEDPVKRRKAIYNANYKSTDKYRESRKAGDMRYRKAHREELKAYNAEWRKNNSGYFKEWRMAHPNYGRDYYRSHVALRRIPSVVTITLQDIGTITVHMVRRAA